MSAIPYSYAITFDPGGDFTGPTDITKRVERLEVIEIGSGQIRSAKIRLNAQFGAFVTNTNAFGDGVNSTPLLDEYQKLRVTIQDRNTNTLDAVYEVDNLKPLQNTQQGTVLEVELLGLERHLQRVHFSKPFFFESGFEVSRDIVDFYNSPQSKGSDQAVVVEHDDPFPTGGNELPPVTANEYDFDVSENYAYEGLISVIDRLGSSVAAGGAGDFFELFFNQDFTNFNQILFKGFISGNPPEQQINPPTDKTFDPAKAETISVTQSVNPGEEEGGIEATVGTVTATWGGDNFGSIPTEFSEFNSALEAFQLSPLHIVGEFYRQDSIVQDGTKNGIDNDNTHYRANADTTTTPPSVDWDAETFAGFLTFNGISSVYSPFTFTQSLAWKNSGSNPNGAIATGNIATDSAIDFDAAGCWDSNLVIVDFDISRTSVDKRAISTASVNAEYFYGGTTIGQYRGFRILVAPFSLNLGALGVPFTQNGEQDRFGNDYANSVVQNNGAGFTGAEEFKNWDVFALPRADTATADPVQREVQYVGVDDEGRVYQFIEDPPSTFIWTDVSGDTSQRINDCYHPYQDLQFVQGYNNKDNEAGGNFGAGSAIRYTWISRISDSAQSDNRFYKVGAWACFKFPFPSNTFNFGGGREIGELYGDAQAGFPTREPATLDTNNMHFTSDGQIGFNNTSAEDLGPIDSLVFYTRFRYKQDLGDNDDTLFLIGDLPIRATCYDTSDNVVTQDFVIAFNNQWIKISLPLANFKIYRARKPTIFGPITDAFLQQLEVLNVFEWKNFKKIAFQWMRSYDDNGRYSPILKSILTGIQEFFTGSGQGISPGRVDWFFDGFNFEKPLLSVSPPDTSRSLQPRFFHEPFITNKFQLDQSNLAKTEITKFRHKQYELVTEGIIETRFGQSFFFNDDQLVRESDFGANTIKLVAKKIRYVIDKTPMGPGGFLRYITGVKRFE